MHAVTSISATMRGNTHLTTLQNQYTVLKMQTLIMQTHQLLGFSRFPSQHLEESRSDVLGGLTDRKKSNWIEKLYSREEWSVSFWGALMNPKFRLSDLLLTATSFFEKSWYSKSCCCTRRSYESSKRKTRLLVPSTFICWLHKSFFQQGNCFFPSTW